MKKAILAVVLVLAATSAQAKLAALTVTVDNIDQDQGEVRVLLCDEANFLTPQCPYIKSQPASPGSLVFAFSDIPAGDWAVLAYHDANSNHDLDRNILGIPTEQFGFSNNPGYNHKPSFAESHLAIADQDSTIEVKLSDK